MKQKALVLIIFFIFFLNYSLIADEEFSHSELKWKIAKTKHFVIYFHQREERFVILIKNMLEDIYKKINTEIGNLPLKIPLFITDVKTEAKGEATPFSDKIYITLDNPIKKISGQVEWFEALLLHEITHIATFNSLAKKGNLLDRAIKVGSMPMWIIEGLAEYMSRPWTSIDDMYLRQSVMNGTVFDLKDLEVFYYKKSKNIAKGYRESFAFCRFIFENGKTQDVRNLLKNMKENFKFGTAFKKTFKCSVSKMYSLWINNLRKKYGEQLKNCDSINNISNPIVKKYNYATSPMVSPSSSKLLFTTSKNRDFGPLALYLKNLKTGKIQKLVDKVNSGACFSFDEKYIYYSAPTFYKKGYLINDLYKINIKTKSRRRITTRIYGENPVASPDGKYIVFEQNRGGIVGLMLYSIEHKTIIPLLRSKTFNHFFSPSWSIDSGKIATSSFIKGQRNIFIIDINSKKIAQITDDNNDNRTPLWLNNSELLYISDSNNNIYNLYSYNIVTKEKKQLTNVIGGVLFPSISNKRDKIYITASKNKRYEICSLDLITLNKSFIETADNYKLWKHIEDFPFKSFPIKDYLTKINIKTNGLVDIKKYKIKLKTKMFIPWVGSDGGPQVGYQSTIGDTLGKHNFVFTTFYGYRDKKYGYKLKYAIKQYQPIFTFKFEDVLQSIEEPLYTYKKRIREGFYECRFPITFNSYYALALDTLAMDVFSIEPGYIEYPNETKANVLKLAWGIDLTGKTLDKQITPEKGLQLDLWYGYSDNKLNSDYKFTEYKIDFRWFESFHKEGASKKKILLLQGRFHNRKRFSEIDKPLYFDLGGPYDMRGFEPGEIKCESASIYTIEYRFTLDSRMHKKMGPLYFDKSYCFLFTNLLYMKQKNELEEKFLYDFGAEFYVKSIFSGKVPTKVYLGLAWAPESKSNQELWLRMRTAF